MGLWITCCIKVLLCKCLFADIWLILSLCVYRYRLLKLWLQIDFTSLTCFTNIIYVWPIFLFSYDPPCHIFFWWNEALNVEMGTCWFPPPQKTVYHLQSWLLQFPSLGNSVKQKYQVILNFVYICLNWNESCRFHKRSYFILLLQHIERFNLGCFSWEKPGRSTVAGNASFIWSFFFVWDSAAKSAENKWGSSLGSCWHCVKLSYFISTAYEDRLQMRYLCNAEQKSLHGRNE